ncbi:MAG: TolC family protein [Candidatus Aminicenantales bacterium]
MRLRMAVVALLSFFLSTLPLFAEREPVLSLTLEDCINKALKNNLSVVIESFNPVIADYGLTRAREVFMPRLEFSYSSQKTQNPPYWWIEGADTVRTRYSNFNASLVQQIPSGGSLSLSLSGYKSNTNQSFQLLNPRYGSTLQFDFTQPLLRNFGARISRKDIIIARNNKDISDYNFKALLLDTIYSVQEAYWSLVYARENLKVKEYSLKLARNLLEKNRKEVELGKLAPIEILNAESEVASREADVIQAMSQVRRSADSLRAILNLEKEHKGRAKIIPLDRPEFTKKEVSLDEALKIVAERRPELLAASVDVDSKELNLAVAKNRMLPQLDLNFSYWSPGISGDRLLYLNDNPFTGIIVGKEDGSAFDSVRDTFRFLYSNWTLSLSLSLPLSSLTTRAEYGQAQLELKQSLARKERLAQDVMLEVRNAVRDIEANAKRVEAYRMARELAEKTLKAEEKKLEVGLSTNYFVLQYQEKLANARSMELKALVDYNLSLAALEKAVGTSLEKRNIKIEKW